jgi:hypothetical protein
MSQSLIIRIFHFAVIDLMNENHAINRKKLQFQYDSEFRKFIFKARKYIILFKFMN